MGSFQRILHILDGMAHGSLQVNLPELLHKQVTVLGVHDGFNTRTQHFHTIFFKYTCLIKLGTAVECRLSAEGKQDAVGTLFLDDLGHEVSGDGQEIDLVGNALRSLDCGNVGVDEHAFNALFTQCLQSL